MSFWVLLVDASESFLENQWDGTETLSDLWEPFPAVRRNSPTSSCGSSGSSYCYSAAWSREGARCPCVCPGLCLAGTAGIMVLSFLGNCGPWENKPVHLLLLLLFFSLLSFTSLSALSFSLPIFSELCVLFKALLLLLWLLQQQTMALWRDQQEPLYLLRGDYLSIARKEKFI